MSRLPFPAITIKVTYSRIFEVRAHRQKVDVFFSAKTHTQRPYVGGKEGADLEIVL
jgi:hypothetical protein